MLSSHRPRILLTTGCTALALATLLTGCSSNEVEEITPTSQTTQPESAEQSPSESTQAVEETTSEETESKRNDSEDQALAEVREKFSSLAPETLFDALDSCTETSIKGSYDCSGKDVGQFQFFDSDSKAASTTQTLTELRSSRVVQDTGRTVVGWSTVGTSALISVVDNEAGQVLQQLMSGDKQDPEERIYELGLADRDAASTATTEQTDQK